MALSAILGTNILEYIYKSLNMHDFVHLYKRSIDCLNIIQIIVKIKYLREFIELFFLIVTAGVVLTISKIMIFTIVLMKE